MNLDLPQPQTPRRHFTPENSPMRAFEDYLRDSQHTQNNALMKFGADLIGELRSLTAKVDEQGQQLRQMREELSGGTNLDALGYKGAILEHETRLKALESARADSQKQRDVRDERLWRLVLAALGAAATAVFGLIGKIIWDAISAKTGHP